MTMLDRMRRHRNWLKWSLALVCLAFVIFYIPDFLQTPDDGPGGRPTRSPSSKARRSRATSSAAPTRPSCRPTGQRTAGSMSDQLLKQLGVDQQILQQMVDERAALAEARAPRHHGRATRKCAQRILSIPAFQENGAFIGEQRYRQLLGMQRPPLSTQEFEEGIRRALLVDKLRAVDHRLAVGDRQGARAGVPAPQRQGEARRGDVPGRQLPAGRDRDRRGDRGATSRRHTGGLPRAREAEAPLRARRHARRCAPRSSCRRPTSSARTTTTSTSTRRRSRSARATSCCRPKARTKPPCSAQAEDVLKQARGGRRLRRARQEVLRGRVEREERRRPRLLRPRPDGAGVRHGGLRAASRDRSATW